MNKAHLPQSILGDVYDSVNRTVLAFSVPICTHHQSIDVGSLAAACCMGGGTCGILV